MYLESRQIKLDGDNAIIWTNDVILLLYKWEWSNPGEYA